MPDGNPCAAIHDFFSFMRRRPNKDLLGKAIAEYIGAAPTDTAAIHRLLADAQYAVIQARRDIASAEHLSDAQKRDFLLPFTFFESAFAVAHLNRSVEAFKEHISDASLATLRSARLAMEHGRDVEQLDIEMLGNLRLEIEALITEIEESALDGPTKNTLIGLLEHVRWAIMTIRLNQRDGINQAIAFCAAIYQIRRDDLTSASQRSLAARLVERTLEVVRNVNAIVGTIRIGRALAQGENPLLGD